LAWVWSDELADSLRKSPELSELIPLSWSARPSAFALTNHEDPMSLGRRLLGVVQPAETTPAGCTCDLEEASS